MAEIITTIYLVADYCHNIPGLSEVGRIKWWVQELFCKCI